LQRMVRTEPTRETACIAVCPLRAALSATTEAHLSSSRRAPCVSPLSCCCCG
jgi:hypothetical protein